MLQFALSGGPSSQTPWLHVAMPQTFPVQLIEQQSPGPLHGTPSSEHFGWQMPTSVSHEPLQHSLSVMHFPPFGWHGPAQTPPEQMPVQQSPAVLQSDPEGRQPPQMPSLQLALQQSPVVLHSKPFGTHAGLHWPPTQLPVQHCDAVAHIAPSGKHWLMHCPPAHVSEQHWLGSVQAEPLPTQLEAHVPFGPQTPLQQSADAPHATPLSPHGPTPQTPFEHASEQQSPAI